MRFLSGKNRMPRTSSSNTRVKADRRMITTETSDGCRQLVLKRWSSLTPMP